jgi:Eco29kI restriction endonuclease
MPTNLYNPLDKKNLARSIEAEILAQDVQPLGAPEQIVGAGVYAIYFRGKFEAYSTLSHSNNSDWKNPIYIGKAIPKGGRKGGISFDSAASSSALANRLKKHAASIQATSNLDIDEFVFQAIALDDIWIPLGENILIERFMPLWNVAIDGFGINDPGRGRLEQKKSDWDVLHPGRGYADKLKGKSTELKTVLSKVKLYFDDARFLQM